MSLHLTSLNGRAFYSHHLRIWGTEWSIYSNQILKPLEFHSAQSFWLSLLKWLGWTGGQAEVLVCRKAPSCGFNIHVGSGYTFRCFFFFIKGPVRRMDGSSLCSCLGCCSNELLTVTLSGCSLFLGEGDSCTKVRQAKGSFWNGSGRSAFSDLVSFFTCLYVLFLKTYSFFFYGQPGLNTGDRYFSSDVVSVSFNQQKLPLFFSHRSLPSAYAFVPAPFCLPHPLVCVLYHLPPPR